MPRLFLFLVLFSGALVRANSGTPPAAQLLPADTLAVFSVPDCDQAIAYWKASPQGKLWQEPALKPFRDKFTERFQEQFVTPLERQLGVKLAEYLDLFHGQLTFAFTPNGWGTEPAAKPAMILIVDAKEKREALTTRLGELKRKWVDSGKQLKTDKIRDVEFTTLILTGEDLGKTLDKAFPIPKLPGKGQDDDDEDDTDDKSDAPSKPIKTELLFGQTGSLLIVGNNAKEIERVLARQSGGLVPALSEQASYEANEALLRGSLAFAWVNFATVFSTFQKQNSASAKAQAGDPSLASRMDKILKATGFGDITSLVGKLSGNPEGTLAEVYVAAPESRRRGLISLFALDRKEASPPPFVGADVVKFSRWRLDGQKAWTTVENMLMSIAPEVAGLLQMGLQVAGKDRDPNFDLKKTLLGSLGDDFISLQKSPRSTNFADVSAPPSLVLVGSANPGQFVQALKAGTALMPLAGGEPNVKEREFLGHTIYALPLPAAGGGGKGKGAGAPRSFCFAASAGYAAMSTDESTLEEYLRSADSTGKSLRDRPGLTEAAQKVGGTSNGFFSFENQAEAVRLWFDLVKNQAGPGNDLLSVAPLGSGRVIPAEESQMMQGWFDLSLLPPWGSVSKYFHFLVSSLGSSADGLSFKVFSPTPPQLQK